MGMSENGVYSQWNSYLVGIMISKTIGYNGVHYFQTHPDGIGIYTHEWSTSLRAYQTEKLEPRSDLILRCFDPTPLAPWSDVQSVTSRNRYPKDPCMEYLPTLGLFKITLGVNVGKYSIHGSSGIGFKVYSKNIRKPAVIPSGELT